MNKRKISPSKSSKSKKSSSFPLFIVLVWVVGILAIIVGLFWGFSAWQRAHQQARLDKIEAIYASFQLDENEYAVTSYNVFGDKRPYDYDKSRSQSSSIEYVHADTPSATMTDLDGKIKAAGFTFIDEPYAGSAAFKEYHYKSKKGEYVRLNVMSKPYFDAIRNDAIMNKNLGELTTPDSFDTNQAPSNVTIKVNLDDNNE